MIVHSQEETGSRLLQQQLEQSEQMVSVLREQLRELEEAAQLDQESYESSLNELKREMQLTNESLQQNIRALEEEQSASATLRQSLQEEKQRTRQLEHDLQERQEEITSITLVRDDALVCLQSCSLSLSLLRACVLVC